MSKPTLEVMFEGRCSQENIEKFATEISLHLDEVYRQHGGRGLRALNSGRDEILGVEVKRAREERPKYYTTVRLLPISESDNPDILAQTQKYVLSPEFSHWLESIQ